MPDCLHSSSLHFPVFLLHFPLSPFSAPPPPPLPDANVPLAKQFFSSHNHFQNKLNTLRSDLQNLEHTVSRFLVKYIELLLSRQGAITLWFEASVCACVHAMYVLCCHQGAYIMSAQAPAWLAKFWRRVRASQYRISSQ